MARNIGEADQLIRVLIGVPLIAAGSLSPGAWHWIALPGIILILTAVFRVCPAYLPFRFRTDEHSSTR